MVDGGRGHESDAAVVVAALGARPNNGYAVLIRDVYDRASSIVVSLTELMPGPGCAVALELTHPMTVARIPRSNKPVEFIGYKASMDWGNGQRPKR